MDIYIYRRMHCTDTNRRADQWAVFPRKQACVWWKDAVNLEHRKENSGRMVAAL